MSMALIFSLMAVAFGLFTVFIAQRTSNLKKQNGSDSGAPISSDTSGTDCSTSDGGACDGDGGGD